MNKIQMDIWNKALEGWEEVSKVTGFETYMDAFCQGYYVSLNMLYKLGKLTKEDLDAIKHQPTKWVDLDKTNEAVGKKSSS